MWSKTWLPAEIFLSTKRQILLNFITYRICTGKRLCLFQPAMHKVICKPKTSSQNDVITTKSGSNQCDKIVYGAAVVYGAALTKARLTKSFFLNIHDPMKAIKTYVMSITQYQPRRDQWGQPCITALHNWWSHEQIYNSSSCTFWQSSRLFLFKLFPLDRTHNNEFWPY